MSCLICLFVIAIVILLVKMIFTFIVTWWKVILPVMGILVLVLVVSYKKYIKNKKRNQEQEAQKKREEEELKKKRELEQAKRAQEEKEKRQQRYLSNELIQRVINDSVEYMVKKVYNANRSNSVRFTKVTEKLTVAESYIRFGDYKYIFEKERYADIPESRLEEVLLFMTTEIISRLEQYFNQHSFGKDSYVSISDYYNINDYKCRNIEQKYSDYYVEKLRASFITYQATNGNFIQATTW